jgi:hypothetical protein
MRRQEVEAPLRALLEPFRKAYFSSARAQVDEGQSQPAVACFQYDWPLADLARIAPQLRRAPAGLPRQHRGRAYRTHRASNKPAVLPALSHRAIFALSTGLPTMGFAMLDRSSAIPYPAPTSRPRTGAARGVPLIRRTIPIDAIPNPEGSAPRYRYNIWLRRHADCPEPEDPSSSPMRSPT